VAQILPHLQFTEEHEWIRIDGESGLVGITEFAQEELGDVTFVELPEIGLVLDRGDVIGVVESVKAASDIFAPLSGEILEINAAVEDGPELVNSDPYGEGWLVRLRIKNPEEVQSLLSSEEYGRLIKGES
jgi:glycine cleavage system H protein